MEGILPLWKERGMTSHDCVARLRRILHTKKIGHSGTLDPDVDGVLPICIGKATKVIEYMMDSGKVYVGEITLGISTTTEDASGDIVEQQPVPEDLTEEMVDEAMQQMTGTIIQIPPMYSAVKVNGRRLYDYARKGEEVERPKREAQIHSFKRTSDLIVDKAAQTVKWRFEVECGKGTYVRTLAVDTGKHLGLPAHMSDLTRTASGGFTEDECLTLEEIAQFMESGTMEEQLLPLERGLNALPRYDLSDTLWESVQYGSLLHLSDLDYTGPFPVVFYKDQRAVGIYKVHPSKEGMLKPSKMLRNSL